MKSIKLNPVAQYILRIDKGEEIYDAILKFCKEKNVKFAELSGIGALENFEYGLYENKKYVMFKEKELCELVSINGTVASVDGELAIHSHAALSKLDNSGNLVPILGHIFNGIVGVTAEIRLNVYDNFVEKKLDPICGIKIFNFDKSM